MIVCHCNYILAVEIEQSARALGWDQIMPPTPHEVYGALGVRPCCGGCLPLAEEIISAALPSQAPAPTTEVRAREAHTRRALIAAE